MTGDDTMFRKQLNAQYKALVCFNDEEITSKFNAIFHQKFESAEKLTVSVGKVA